MISLRFAKYRLPTQLWSASKLQSFGAIYFLAEFEKFPNFFSLQQGFHEEISVPSN